ncbi:uncharacterized protein JCM6883_006415 [Sporobolomyces salmoneus]|uniref:uncharacterized protein n=1 Tax=Sporobolomyces salmoneus TaxID=183962 RepID=UPI00317CF07C
MNLAQARSILAKDYNFAITKNEGLVNSLSIFTWNLASDPVPEGEEKKKSSQVRYFENLGVYLISMETKLSSEKQLESFDIGFDLGRMLVDGGIHEAVETLRNSENFQKKVKLSQIPGIDRDLVGKLLGVGITTPEQLKFDLEKDSEDRVWKHEHQVDEDSQLAFLTSGLSIESSIDAEGSNLFLNILRLYFSRDGPQGVEGVISVEQTGPIGRGRLVNGGIKLIMSKEEWAEEETDHLVKWLEVDRSNATTATKAQPGYLPKPLVSKILVSKGIQATDHSALPVKSSTLDGLVYIQGIHTFEVKNYSVTFYLANSKNLIATRLITRSSTTYVESLCEVAHERNLVIHPSGIYTKQDWLSGGSPLSVVEEKEVFEKYLQRRFVPAISRNSDIGVDYLPWSGATAEEIEEKKAASSTKEKGKKQSKTVSKGRGKGEGKGKGKGKESGQGEGEVESKVKAKGKGKRKTITDDEEEEEAPAKKKGRAKKDSGSGSGVKKRSVEEEEVVSVALTTKRQKTNAAKKGEK